MKLKRDNNEIDPGGFHGNNVGVRKPLGMADHMGSDSRGIQSASLVNHELPTHKTSKGLRTPKVPDPFIEQRVNSYVDNANHYFNESSVAPPSQWTSYGVLFDVFDPDANYKHWELGDIDLLSMFNDNFYDQHDGYILVLETSTLAYQGVSSHDFSFAPNQKNWRQQIVV